MSSEQKKDQPKQKPLVSSDHKDDNAEKSIYRDYWKSAKK